jgi:hypothetical protein
LSMKGFLNNFVHISLRCLAADPGSGAGAQTIFSMKVIFVLKISCWKSRYKINIWAGSGSGCFEKSDPDQIFPDSQLWFWGLTITTFIKSQLLCIMHVSCNKVPLNFPGVRASAIDTHFSCDNVPLNFPVPESFCYIHTRFLCPFKLPCTREPLLFRHSHFSC